MKFATSRGVLNICTNHNGKMEGMASISTSTLKNANCLKNAEVVGSICSHCYAQKQLKAQPTHEKVLSQNLDILSSAVLNDDEIPFINNAFFRFEAFGDLANETQFINYCKIAEHNKHCTFSIWTKNPFIVASAFKKVEKPSNMIIILSSLMVNKPIEKPFKWVDKVFTCYDKEYAEEHNISINCGAKKCMTCLKCYKKNTTAIINELVK